MMTTVTTRTDFEKLICLRMEEAKLLIDQKQDWNGAYYLAGYAVEFALKICIISQLMRSDSFPDQSLVKIYYTHNLIGLRNAAGLDDEMDKDQPIRRKWLIVKDWKEHSRYQLSKTEQEAVELYDAIEKEVLPWIKARW